MKRPVLITILLFAATIFSSGNKGWASEQMRSANTMEAGKVAVSVYGIHSKNEDLELRLGNSSLVQVPLSGGGTAQIFADSNTDLLFEGEGTATFARFTWRPDYGLHYSFKLGTGDYEVQFPSGSVVNTLETSSPGILWGVDVSWTLMPDTPAGPAVAVAVGYAQSDYRLDKFQSGGQAPAGINQHFSLREWQGSISVSKKWKQFEPYAGGRVFGQTSVLNDRATAQTVRGTREGAALFAGLRFKIFSKEALIIEVSGLDETSVGAGLSINF